MAGTRYAQGAWQPWLPHAVTGAVHIEIPVGFAVAQAVASVGAHAGALVDRVAAGVRLAGRERGGAVGHHAREAGLAGRRRRPTAARAPPPPPLPAAPPPLPACCPPCAARPSPPRRRRRCPNHRCTPETGRRTATAIQRARLLMRARVESRRPASKPGVHRSARRSQRSRSSKCPERSSRQNRSSTTRSGAAGPRRADAFGSFQSSNRSVRIREVGAFDVARPATSPPRWRRPGSSPCSSSPVAGAAA